MWEFYLAGCECAFRFDLELVFQLQLASSMDAVPITRDDISDREARLRARENAQAAMRAAR